MTRWEWRAWAGLGVTAYTVTPSLQSLHRCAPLCPGRPAPPDWRWWPGPPAATAAQLAAAAFSPVVWLPNWSNTTGQTRAATMVDTHSLPVCHCWPTPWRGGGVAGTGEKHVADTSALQQPGPACSARTGSRPSFRVTKQRGDYLYIQNIQKKTYSFKMSPALKRRKMTRQRSSNLSNNFAHNAMILLWPLLYEYGRQVRKTHQNSWAWALFSCA